MKLLEGDCLEIMPTLDACSVDAIVTDPPYGLSFMGKHWDHGIPGEAFWFEALRVAKPGCHLLAFGGTRTFHRMTCAIEDAGWEIRDCLMWVYGSGFPKSLDVSKAIDKAAGIERPRVPGGVGTDTGYSGGFKPGEAISGEAISGEAIKWQGWGTALKPAVEYIIVAQKTLDLRGHCGILAQTIGGAICQLQSDARGAGKSSMSSRSGQSAECDSALWNAVPVFNTPGDLFAAMDTLQSASEMPSSLSIALSWLDILGAVYQGANTFTTEMESSLITDLKILNSSPSKITPQSLIEAATNQPGTASNASLVASVFNVVSAKLASILTPSAPGLVTSKDDPPGLRPNWHPIILARKAVDGTIAANVQKYGTGAMNIDGCRIEAVDKRTPETRPYSKGQFGGTEGNGVAGMVITPVEYKAGRFPANLIHDGSEEVLEGFPNGKSGDLTGQPRVENKIYGSAANTLGTPRFYKGDSGSASRFFYCAKASKADRDEGLDGRYAGRYAGTKGQESYGRNNHPTVKPTALMRYLCRLITPPQGIILDPFMGSGSTGKAAMLEGFDFIGIEKEAEYLEIACARIAAAQKQEKLALQNI